MTQGAQQASTGNKEKRKLRLKLLKMTPEQLKQLKIKRRQ